MSILNAKLILIIIMLGKLDEWIFSISKAAVKIKKKV